MNAGADELAAILEGAAGSGQPLDFWQHIGRLSMDVTGSTVFGHVPGTVRSSRSCHCACLRVCI